MAGKLDRENVCIRTHCIMGKIMTDRGELSGSGSAMEIGPSLVPEYLPISIY